MAERIGADISLVEGIGDARGAALRQAGLGTIGTFLAARRARVVAALPSAPPAHLAAWRGAAMLLRLDEVTPDEAEAFVAAGVDSLDRLREAGLRTLEQAVADSAEAGRMSDVPSLYRLAEIQREAWRRRHTGGLVGSVLQADGAPAVGQVRAGRVRAAIGADGGFAIDGVPDGGGVLDVEIEGRPRDLEVPVTVVADAVKGPVRVRLPAQDHAFALMTRREADGELFTPTGPARWRWDLVWADADSLPVGARLVLRGTATRPHLLQMERERLGDRIRIFRYRIAPDAVPADAASGDVVEVTGDGYVRSPLGRDDLLVGRFARAFDPGGTSPT